MAAGTVDRMHAQALVLLRSNLPAVVPESSYKAWVDDVFMVAGASSQMFAFANISLVRILRIFFSSNKAVDFFSADEIKN
eukprot:1819408-Prymnesium_polylepis.1